MLKTSWSIEEESSTTTSTSVCGIEVGAGPSVSSSSSTTRFSASLASIGGILRALRRLLAEVLQLAKLALDLLLDVERLLALPLRRSLRATTSWRTSSRRPWSPRAWVLSLSDASSFSTSASTSSGFLPLATPR